ncbi:uncharacterized protein Tco025E_00629 [Trypanosoma conorhini]|uniref:Uncharacterized protein n=1 Tax=Trypanosoma conorhini TaxID=83891 RepID=A0A3R7N8E4_9TRYP|nr:uncharacterized protein Tco025E_00629 [Trypanosoma conorhini]RNF27131.1 hypothetical protein Tco025E_00629 [Trypanosoma conorhini]
MTALLQQLQHVLATWDTANGAGEQGTIDCGRKRGSSRHKHLFMASVEAAAANVHKGATAGDGSHGAARKAKESYPLWLTEMDCGADDDDDDDDEVVGRRSLQNAPDADLHAVSSSDRPLDPLLSRRRITKVELARAALALFTSNSGIYRPILQKTLGFIFGLIDELLEEKADFANGGGAPQNCLPAWSATEKEEVAAAHERMRMMEVRMAKLVDEAAMQRDHLKAEIVAAQAREAKLEGLLKHQFVLSHARGVTGDAAVPPDDDENSARYVKRLIARAANEKAVDELQGEVTALQKERDELSRRLQELMTLNGKYAQQCVELAARLSVLTDHNIAFAVECQKHQNETLLQTQRSERLQRDLQITRNVLMSVFVSRHSSLQSWWESLRENRMKKAAEAFLRFAQPPKRLSSASEASVGDEASPAAAAESKEGTALAGKSETGGGSKEAFFPAAAAATTTAVVNDNALCHFWLPRAGNNPDTPEHLRSFSSVEYVRMKPLVAESIVYVILSQWRQEAEAKSLDVFTRDYVLHAIQQSELDSQVTPETSLQPGVVKKANKHLVVTYAIDAVSRGPHCGSLTYAFGLVSRKQVTADLFRMLEFDAAMLIAICRFLDMERVPTGEPQGLIPVVQFASVLVAMYPSYPLALLRQLLDAARNDAGNQTESLELLNYNVLLPERLFLSSASITVENAGVLWSTLFKHLLYEFICDDVVDSWQAIEDALCAYSISASVASEHQILYQAMGYASVEDGKYWLPAIRVALSSWDALRAGKNSLLLEHVPHVPVKAVAKYLRDQLLIRRGTRPASSKDSDALLSGLQEQWNKFAGSHGELDFERYVRLVESLDGRRHAVWGPAAMAASNIVRYVDPSEDLSVSALLARLQEGKKAKE